MRIFAGALALAMISFAAPAGAVPTMAAHTKVIVFDAASLHATAHKSGYCWTSSIASRRSDAYRCMAGNEIYDPCFTLSSRSVGCPTDATANKGIVLNLTRPLPGAGGVHNAWQMTLASGAVCNRGTGTVIPGFPFYCAGSLVCSSPPDGEPAGAVFVHCAKTIDGKPGAPSSYLVLTLVE